MGRKILIDEQLRPHGSQIKILTGIQFHRISTILYEMAMAWFDILGTLGVSIIILTYVFLQIGRIGSEQLAYSLLNAVGAALILISLYFDFNFPSFIVEFFWLLISLFGIGKSFAKGSV